MTAITALIISLIAGLLPGFAWLIFYLGEDDHAEPKRLIIFTFIAGMAFGFFTVAIENVYGAALAHWNIAEFSVASLVELALIEETMKFAAAHFAASKSPAFEHPTDAMIFMIVAALGFATLENIGALSSIPLNTLFVPAFFETLSFRFIGATLLHSLASAVVGYYWAIGLIRGTPGRWITLGIGLAALLHACFNYLILNYGNGMYTVVFIVIIGFFVLNDFEKIKTFPKELPKTS
jgi:RsiW-degrading membrane proteinase PrsW (M82 family)